MRWMKGWNWMMYTRTTSYFFSFTIYLVPKRAKEGRKSPIPTLPLRRIRNWSVSWWTYQEDLRPQSSFESIWVLLTITTFFSYHFVQYRVFFRIEIEWNLQFHFFFSGVMNSSTLRHTLICNLNSQEKLRGPVSREASMQQAARLDSTQAGLRPIDCKPKKNVELRTQAHNNLLVVQ